MLSALLDRRVDLPRELLEQISNASLYNPARVEICHAHRKTRPLYLALADRWHQIGERDRALGVIDTVRRQMIEARQPAEMLAQLDAVKARLSAKPPESVAVDSMKQTWSRRIGSVASGVFALLLGLAGIGTIVALTGAAIGWVAGRPQLLLPFVVAVTTVVVYLGMRSLGRTLTAVFKPTLVLSVGGPEGVRAARWNYVAGFPRLLDWRKISEGDMSMPGSDPYVEEGARLSGLTARLRPIFEVRLFGRIAYELLIEPSLQPVPWEALAHAGLAGRVGDVKEQFQFFRSSFSAPAASRRRSWRDDNAVSIVGRAHDTTSLHQLWTRHVDPDRLTIYGEREVTKTALTSSIRVLHLIGRTRTGSGVGLFQVTAEGYQAASELQPEFAHVVIVQCRPQESFDRTQTDREQTASLRGFAAEVFEAGAGTVVFLPIMPAVIGERVAHKLAEFCMRATVPSRVAWLNHVSGLREIILRSASRSETRLSEAAKRYQQSDAVSEIAETVSDEELAVATREMAMDVTLWLRDSGVPVNFQADMFVPRPPAA